MQPANLSFGALGLFRKRRKLCQSHRECVRVLAAYALVRRDESYTEGGWLTAPESHQQWLKLGGNPNSGIERLGFERGKLRSQLRKAGVLDVKDLFERKHPDIARCYDFRRVPIRLFFSTPSFNPTIDPIISRSRH